MKSSLILLVLVPFIAAEGNRAKRFAALATGIGGTAGCVVTGNVLYANGFALRNLTSAEQSELTTYQQAVTTFKTQLKTAIQQKREQFKQQIMNQNNANANNNNAAATTATDDDSLEPPARPSFCSEATTTQYYFDGCMVQNNKVYVGKTFARDLTSDEQQQLQTFDTAMTAYQKQVQDDIHSQMKGMFGGKDFFAALFGGDVQDDNTQAQAQTSTSTAVQSSTPAKLDAPTAPQFCIAI